MTPTQSRDLLSALSAECVDMGAAVDGLAAVVFDHARRLPAAERAEVLVQAQGIDLVAQTLAALSALTEAVADGASLEAAIDAVPLAGVADRLRAAVLGQARAIEVVPDGDLVLFD